MTTFGEFPGVRINTTGGGIASIEIGEEEKVVLFGRADTENGDAEVNEPAQVRSRRDAQRLFGEDSELRDAVQGALANGANREYIFGVPTEQTVADTETFTATDSGTLVEAPLSEGTVAVGTLDVEYRYDDDIPVPETVDTVFVNPNTGDWTAFEEGEYDFEYEYPDWNSAFDSADDVVLENESAVYVALAESETVGQSLAGKVTELRQNYKMVKGLVAAEPTGTDDGAPSYNPSTYEDNYDSDSFFVTAPVRRTGTPYTVLGGVGGLFAGNSINDPIYNEPLSGYTGLVQRLTHAQANEFRAQNVIPIKEAASIRVADNISTSSEEDWQRDFWRRRIVDRVILLAKNVGDATIGRVNDKKTRKVAETALMNEIEGLVSDRLLRPNDATVDEENWYVDVRDDPTDSDTVLIDIGITPTGVVKRVDVTIEIDT